ncbi:N-acetylmuramoyl-L-alanine amidase family protein [Pelagicoccus mobilis]|uniref:N-acetylmuramoyl-L-alanine amidase n=1 Tax=Pelagicoccus mobilis TaxID=415221 RepID=A0A934RTX1_9BACT|nr:N-acetylmuramoyl-L-alanine amidase [Pelagicoccus mobilis]MBK1876358.1 N-acetylmuramoyl-L-alanine amidase [Pelagicoccus mobilis]
MRIFNRSGTLFIGGVAASLFLIGCQSTQSSRVEEVEEAPVASPPVEVVTEVPSEQDIVRSGDAEMRELEEDLLLRKKTGDEKARSLKAIAKRLNAKLERFPEEKEWKLSKEGRTLVLKENSRIAFLDGIKVFLDRSLKKSGAYWSLGESDEKIILEPVFGVSATVSQVSTVVIDPGHGGSQDGTKNESLGVLEKEMTLDVSLRLSEHLEKAGFKVVLTRYDDRLVGLDDRAKMANGLKADLFVSVHFNAALNKEAKGLETYLLTPAGEPSSSSSEPGGDVVAYPGNRFDAANFELAYRIQSSLLERLGREDRGVKKARFRVLKSLDCPGVLAECGFVSNRDEGLLVSTAGYRERVAQALADAILEYAKSSKEES